MRSNATGGSENEGQDEEPRFPHWLRWVLSKWWGLVVLVAGGLAVNVLLFPLAKGFDNWGPGIESQVAALLALRETHPFVAGMTVIAVPVLTLIGFFANRAIKRDEQRKHDTRQRSLANEVATEQLATFTGKVQETIEPLRRLLETPSNELPTHVSAPSGLPRAVGFVGRTETLVALMTDLRDGRDGAAFALTGMAGVGKTALAAEAVARLSADSQIFPSGAVWIACEDLSGPDGLAEVWSRVARALDATEVIALPDNEQRRTALHALLARGSKLLLALDTVDALEVGPLLETLSVQDHTTLVLVARQSIDLPGLRARPLETLPDDEAQALFAQTLSRTSRQPRPTSDDEAALPGLVAALGGLPLAIELTATYAGRQGLALATVQQEIEHDGVQAASFLPAQHQAQRALVLRFDRSWRALTETSQRQRLFAALSLLKGDSFPRAAALALALTIGGEQATQASAAGDVAALVDYALVEALAGERLRLHALLRDYASKRLASDYIEMRDQLGKAMVVFWRTYAQAHPGYEGISALEAEAPGLLGALEWAHDHALNDEVLALVHALARAWDVRRRNAERLRMYTWAEQAAKTPANLKEQLWATHQLAGVHWQTGQLAESRRGIEHALDLARTLGSLKDEREEVHALAVLDRQMGRLDEARAGYQRALGLAEQLHDPAAVLDEVHGLAALAHQTGRASEARAGYELALDLACTLGGEAAERVELHSLALLDMKEGRPTEARAGFERALALARQMVDPAAEREEVHELAVLDGKTGRNAEARAGFEQALAIARQTDDKGAELKERHSLALLDLQLGQFVEARAGFEVALHLARDLRDQSAEQAVVHSLAVLADEMGQWGQALASYEQALDLALQLGDPEAESLELSSFGFFLSRHGELAFGRQMIERSLAISERLHDVYIIGKCHQWLAWIEQHAGNQSVAVAHLREALARLKQVQSPDEQDVCAELRKLGEQI